MHSDEVFFEFFVGISERTNELGAQAVKNAFPEYPVTPIKIHKKFLHLKSFVSMSGPDLLCVSSTQEAQEAVRSLIDLAKYKYDILEVPVNTCAVTLYINGTLVHRSEYLNCTEIFEKKINYNRVGLKIWELSKTQANLTCLSILVDKKPE